MQHDPYDQFASGYVGMGNDPGNGVDPSGGIFGGLDPSIGNALQNFGGTLDNVTVWGKAATITTTTIINKSFALASQSILSLASNLVWNMAGFSAALADNAFGTDLLTSNAPSSGESYEAKANWMAGVQGGNAASMALAVMEGAAGKSLMAGGGLMTVSVVGAEVGVPATLVGGGMTLHSFYLFGNSVRNTVEMNGMVKFESEVQPSESGGSTTGDSPPAETLQDFKKVNGNSEGNKVSREAGYKDAHDLKRAELGEGADIDKFNIYQDRKSGNLELRDRDEKIRIPVTKFPK